MKVMLNTIKRVKDFVKDMEQFESSVDIKVGRYIIDAKSELGIFSLDLSNPLETYIISSNEDELLRFEEVVKKYEV